MTRNTILASALLVLLAGCGSTPKTMILHPQKVWTFFTAADDHATFSCPPIGCPLVTTGTGKGVTPGRVTVGFDSTFDPGTLPCNCWEWTATATRGAVMFNTMKLPKKFATAILVVTPSDVNRIEGDKALGNEDGTITSIFLPQSAWDGVVTQVFTDANGTDAATLSVGAFAPEAVAWIQPFPMNPGTTFPASGPPVRRVGANYEIDATSQFKAWQNHTETNNGFMFVGRNESLPGKENQAWEAAYNVVVRVLYNPDDQ